MICLKSYGLKLSWPTLGALIVMTVLTIFILATNQQLGLYVPGVILTDSEMELSGNTTDKNVFNFRDTFLSKTRNRNDHHEHWNLSNRRYINEVHEDIVDNLKVFYPYARKSAFPPKDELNDIESNLTTSVKGESVSMATTTRAVTEGKPLKPSFFSSSDLLNKLLFSSLISSESAGGLSQQRLEDDGSGHTDNGKFIEISDQVIHNETNTTASQCTINITIDDNAVLKNIHNERIQTIHKICNKRQLYENDLRKHESFFYTSNKYNFSYCKVPKCGSTFWTQMFGVLEYGLKYGETVFNKRRNSVHSTQKRYVTSFKLIKTLNSRTVLVSRDPYSRLFSAYIDKVFLPLIFSVNYKIRNITENWQCPINVTLEEFLDWIILESKRGATLNKHWAPIVSLCRPCDLNAFILVKQESFSADVEFALRQFKLEEDNFKYIMAALHDHRIELTIPGIIATVYDRMTKRDVRNCFTYSSLAKRIWISLQIQGYIDENIDFPEEKFISEGMLMQSSFLSDIVLKTIREHPLNAEQTKLQRHTFLSNAYRNVKIETIQGIQELYKQDFEVFEYSKNPPGQELPSI